MRSSAMQAAYDGLREQVTKACEDKGGKNRELWLAIIEKQVEMISTMAIQEHDERVLAAVSGVGHA